MPDPKSGEKREEYIPRCVKEVMGEGKSQEQALGQCYGMWRGAHDAMSNIGECVSDFRAVADGLLNENMPDVNKKVLFSFCGMLICEVDGTKVRDVMPNQFPDPNDPMGFVLGGHPLRYPWIPDNPPEIWVVRQSPTRDKVAVGFFHEPLEYLVMRDLGMKYDDAHSLIADLGEHAFRIMCPPEVEAFLCELWEKAAEA